MNIIVEEDHPSKIGSTTKNSSGLTIENPADSLSRGTEDLVKEQLEADVKKQQYGGDMESFHDTYLSLAAKAMIRKYWWAVILCAILLASLILNICLLKKCAKQRKHEKMMGKRLAKLKLNLVN